MITAGARALSSSAKRTLVWQGATNAEVRAMNPGEGGEKAVDAIEALKVAAEKMFPTAHTLKVQGALLHESFKDPNQKGKVITVSVETVGGTRLASYHASEDGTSTQKITRAGEKAVRAAASGDKQ